MEKYQSQAQGEQEVREEKNLKLRLTIHTKSV